MDRLRLTGLAFLIAVNALAGAETVSVLVKLKNRYDLSRFNSLSPISPSVRANQVADALSLYTQQGFSKDFPLLKEDPRNGIESVKPLWLAGMVKVTGRKDVIERNLSWSRSSEIEIEKLRPVERDETISATPSRQLAWGVTKSRAEESWNQGARGQGIVVAVLDSGLAVNHPDLAGNVWSNPGEVGKDETGADKSTNGRDDDENGYVDDVHGWNFEENSADISDSQGHGTQAAGVVAGNGKGGTQTGVAPLAKIMVLKACCMLGGEAAESVMWEALQYAVKNGARVISMSVTMRPFGNPNWGGWRRVGEVLNAAGIIHVNSAGNRGTGNEPFNIGAPASNPPAWLHPEQKQSGSLSSMITVGAIDASDVPRAYSSAGPVSWEHVEDYKDFIYDGGSKLGLIKPDICGPSEVPSLSHDGHHYTASFGGTSSATPHVAGAVADLLSVNPNLSVADVTRILQLSAVPVGGSFGNRCGAGRLDILKAVQMARETLR